MSAIGGYGTNHVPQTITDNSFTRLASGAMQSVFGASDELVKLNDIKTLQKNIDDHGYHAAKTEMMQTEGMTADKYKMLVRAVFLSHESSDIVKDSITRSKDITRDDDKHFTREEVNDITNPDDGSSDGSGSTDNIPPTTKKPRRTKKQKVEDMMNNAMKIPTQQSSTQDGSTVPPTPNYQLPPTPPPPTPNYQLPPTPPPPIPQQSTPPPPNPEPSTRAPSTQPPTPPPPVPPIYAENATPVFNSDRMRQTAPIGTTELLFNVGLQGLRHLGMLAIGQAAVPYIGADGSKLLYSSMRTLNSMDRKGDHATAARIAGVEGSDAIFDVLLKNGDVSEASHRFHSLSRGQLDSIGTIDNQIIDSFSRNLRTSNSLTTARRSQQTEYKNQFGGI